MKITVSIPDQLFALSAEALAVSRGLNSSQLYAQALMSYLAGEQQTLSREVDEINAALAAMDADPAYTQEQADLATVYRKAARCVASHVEDH